MAQNIISNIRSLSDSEINERNLKQTELEQQRTKRYSGSHVTSSTTAMGYFSYPIKSLVDYEMDVIHTSENFQGLSRQTVSGIAPGRLDSIPVLQEHIYFQDQIKTPWKEHSLGGNEVRNQVLASEVPSSRSQVSQFTTENSFGKKEQTSIAPIVSMPQVTSNTDLTQKSKNLLAQECSSQSKYHIGTNVPVEKQIEFPILDVPSNNMVTFPILEVVSTDISTSPISEVPAKNNMYSTSDDIPAKNSNNPFSEVPAKDNFLMPSEDFIGEPRCVALKKYTTDDDMEDALELNFAEFDEDEESVSEQQPPKISTKKTQKKNLNDMFLDDDDPNEAGRAKSIPLIDLANPKKNWGKPAIEIEEGELTPDLYSTTFSDLESKKNRAVKNSTQGAKESNRDKKPARKESSQDFFLKINRCFRQLEREFCNMHVPRGSRRMIGQLQNTLCNVDRMKRRLTFLIDSAKNTSRDKSKNDESFKDDRHASSKKESFDESRSKSSKVESGRFERVNSLLRDSIRTHKEVEAKMNRHIRRTPATIAYAGTKQEKQRIQSLFKRQMNLITQHVIQKKDTGKVQNPKPGGTRIKNTIEKVPEGPKAPELKTLDEMEAFLAVLKIQKSQKEEIMAKENQKTLQGPLRFTTKKCKPLAERRQQPVLLLSANQAQVLSVENQIDEEEWKKQAEVLQTMSQKRKEILENKKDYEEVRLLQEQLQKLTNMSISSELDSRNSDNTKFQKPQEQSITKKSTKDEKIGEEIPVKEMEEKKDKETSKEEEKPRKEVIDSCSGEKAISKKNLKEMECVKPSFQPRSSDCESKSRKVISKNSKKLEKRKPEEEKILYSETSGSDNDSNSELKDQILKKRKRIESDTKLSSAKRHKKLFESKRKSLKWRHSSNIKKATVFDGYDEKLLKELRSKKLLIVGDKNMSLLNKRFCLKIIENQIYLKKVGNIKRANKSGPIREQRKSQSESNKKIRNDREKKMATIDAEEKLEPTHTLQDMEEFLLQLRARKKVLSEDRDYVSKLNQQSREAKFMARIQAKRKAKLMACVSSVTKDITEKEAKFLKDLESRSRDPGDSPDTEKKKQKLMQKIREETDAIVLAQKQVEEEDPLSDVKTFLNMIKEAESGNDEKSKQFCVSFSMKRSDVKQLENITTGKTSALTEESQKFLNIVRSKMKAKKVPSLEVGDHGQKA